MSKQLSEFYADWSKKPDEELEWILETCSEKSRAALKTLDEASIGPVDSVLEVGCGYGKNLRDAMDVTGASVGVGTDFSEAAIAIAKERFGDSNTTFLHTPSLSIEKAAAVIRETHSDAFDLVLLFDLLEHIPRPKRFMRTLGSMGKHFLIKLPLENSVYDNYLSLRRKTYPSSRHPDGHLREFHVDSVHAFVTSLGFTPLSSDCYAYASALLYPQHAMPKNPASRLYHEAEKRMKAVCKAILPKRLFLRLIGGGGFVCLATWSEDHILDE
ncbi:MAG: hypothetical protein AUJ52_12520 [Elusimicrobia bacterium CG1_02_63_36]|nr:MAG: hypothetical protein AUJ52_12520 [Elusimicrobia bacterium CG1_02_63_36]